MISESTTAYFYENLSYKSTITDLNIIVVNGELSRLSTTVGFAIFVILATFVISVSIVIFVDIANSVDFVQVLIFRSSEHLLCHMILDSPIPLTKSEDRQIGE